LTFSTSGGVQLPSRIEGAFSCGQYMRNISMNSPLGAGNRFASLSLPGGYGLCRHQYIRPRIPPLERHNPGEMA
jgi:hypothetical protein